MGKQTKVSLSELERFIRHDLKHKLQRDLRQLKIVKEADLECASYYHLRRFVRRDDRWRVLARRYAQKTGRYIDLLIFRKGVPRIAIEFKWKHSQISGKDRKSLVACLKRLWVNKVYFFSAVRHKSSYRKLRKRKVEKYSLHECVVGLDLRADELARYDAQRAQFREEMRRGKARH